MEKKSNYQNKTVSTKEGDLILFPGHIKHSVPEHTIDENRISIAGNLTTAWDIRGQYVYNASDIV